MWRFDTGARAWLLCSLALQVACTARAGERRAPRTLRLAEGDSALGVARTVARAIRPGPDHDCPALAVASDGRVVVAVVSLEGERERVYLRTADRPDAALGPARAVSAGARAWHPSLAAGPDGAVWLAWCGAATARWQQRGVWARRVLPGEPGPPVRLSAASARAANPSLAVASDGTVHAVWEQSSPDEPTKVRIAHRALSAQGRVLGPVELISAGPFDRRPTALADSDRVHVAWDSLMDRVASGAVDPDYDVFLRTRAKGGWRATATVDRRLGIQAAPALAPAGNGAVYVAYHSSHRHGLVKWWTVRRVRDGGVEQLVALRPAASLEPSGQQQGAEFPTLVVLPGGGLAVFSRPSQGAYLQLVDVEGVSAPLDLTRHGWGARGIRLQAALAPDGSVLLVRRARAQAVLERFELRPKRGGSPVFKPGLDPAKPPPPPIDTRPGLPGEAAADPTWRLYWGDLHMHSAVTDGTGPADEILARAWVRGLHFAALTDHDNIVGKRTFPSLQDEVAWVTEAFDGREAFAAFHAYEWTSPPLPAGYGHHNVYFRGRPQSPWCAYRGSCSDSRRLFAALSKGQAIAVPHHTSWTGTDWPAADEDIQRLLEVVSVHGASELRGGTPIPSRGEMEGMFAQDGLRRGLVFGFVGGSDGHGLSWHHGIARKRDPWACGLTGVFAAAGDRQTLFDALYRRRSIATSGERMSVFLRVGGVPMGARGRVAAPPVVRLSARGTRSIREVVVLRDGRVIKREKGRQEVRFVDSRVEAGAHWYYARVIQGEGARVDVAWSSPVFLTLDSRERTERRSGR